MSLRVGSQAAVRQRHKATAQRPANMSSEYQMEPKTPDRQNLWEEGRKALPYVVGRRRVP